MATQAADVSSVMVVGRSPDLTASLVAALRRLGADVIEGPASCVVDSMVVVLVPDRAAARVLNKASTDALCDTAVGAVLDTGARRLIVVSDGRHLTFGQRTRAAGVARRAARRIEYECEVNGSRGIGASYAVVDTADDIARIAAVAASAREGLVSRS
ncbi:hypothetical protein MPNTM1_01368 [Mycolicibacterium parafortuitum]|uniref:hypothetical protein n=1 Tax=Mycolicibacterium parafortuitum TaxID=39692 RepID=UPI0032C457A0